MLSSICQSSQSESDAMNVDEIAQRPKKRAAARWFTRRSQGTQRVDQRVSPPQKIEQISMLFHPQHFSMLTLEMTNQSTLQKTIFLVGEPSRGSFFWPQILEVENSLDANDSKVDEIYP